MDSREMIEFFKTRRTYRRFTQQPVPRQTVDAILEAARLASCGNNRQPLNYLVVQSPDMVQKTNALVKWAAALPPEIGTPKPEEIPTLFVAVLQNSTISPNAALDAGLAMANMTAAAWADGVGSCILGNINRPALCELLGIAEPHTLLNLVAFGYPSHQSTVVDCQNGDTKYFVDDARDYFVPKRSLDELVLGRL